MKLKIICLIAIFVLANCLQRKVGENELCNKNKSNCNKGLVCTKIPVGKDDKETWSFEFKCKKENFKFGLGEFCIWKRFGSNCQRDNTVNATCSELTSLRSGIKVGKCIDPKVQNNSQPISTTTEKKEENVETRKIEDLENEEVEQIIEVFEAIQKNVKGKDTFTTGYLILQYFVDKDEISNNEILKLIENLLSDKTKKRECEDIENQFDYLGSHIINLWSTEERNKYLWLVNNNYIKGLQDVNKKASLIKGISDANGGVLSKIQGDFSSGADIIGGFIKSMIDLAITTIVDKQITNIMLAAASINPTSGDGSSSQISKDIFFKNKNNGSYEFGEGFGAMPNGSICKELKVAAGLKYLGNPKTNLKKMRKIKKK